MSFNQSTDDVYGRFGNELYPKNNTIPLNETLTTCIREITHTQSQLPNQRFTLIVGRGTKPETTLKTFNADVLVFCDRFGGAFMNRTAELHLWMDFNNLHALNCLPSEMFDSIVIDWSTWRYMNPLKPGVLSEWKRILKVGGTFVFECGVSSMKYTHGEELIYLGIDLTDSRQIMKLLRFDFDNLTHLVVPIEIAKVLIERACNEILTSGWNEEHGNSVSQTQVGSNIVKNDKRSPIDRLRGASSHEVKKSGVNLDTTPRILPAAKSAVCCCANSVVEIFAELRLSEFRRKILERKIISPQDVSSEFESNECDMIVAYYLNEILELKYHDMFCGVEGENFFTKMTVYCSGGQLTSDFVKETELKYPIKTKGEIKRWIELIK